MERRKLLFLFTTSLMGATIVSCTFEHSEKDNDSSQFAYKTSSGLLADTLMPGEATTPDSTVRIEKPRITPKQRSDVGQTKTSDEGRGPQAKRGSTYSTKGITADSHYIVTDLPAGYVENGTVDYTAYIQRAIERYDNLVFPPFPILINDNGLIIGSNKILTFLKGSELWLKPSVKRGYFMLDIKEASNVILYNPVVKGDRYNHLGVGGEWGMGIGIRGSSNVQVFGAHVSNCWGDGIYIGEIGKNFVSKEIVIKDAYLSKNRRDGISIISVDGLILENVYAGFQDGTKPMCGINFETDNLNCEIKNVTVINPRTEYNQGSGIQIGVSTLLGGSLKNVDVKIINHIDIGSKSFAMKVACNRKSGIYGGSVSGIVNIINPSWNATIGDRPLAFITDQPNLKVEVSSPKIKKSNGNVLNSLEIQAILRKHSIGELSIFQNK